MPMTMKQKQYIDQMRAADWPKAGTILAANHGAVVEISSKEQPETRLSWPVTEISFSEMIAVCDVWASLHSGTMVVVNGKLHKIALPPPPAVEPEERGEGETSQRSLLLKVADDLDRLAMIIRKAMQ